MQRENSMKMSKFSETVLNIVKLIPSGTVVSYGQVALMAGVPRAARQVGRILHIYSETYNVPWWRVINNAGRISTNCLEHTAQDQKELLEKEGVEVKKLLKIDIEKYRFRPGPEIIEKLKLDDRYVRELMETYLL
jgi:methylated-DNA-protein-cysteine methyltransferase-like protein